MAVEGNFMVVAKIVPLKAGSKISYGVRLLKTI
jgi:hypothetical protein